MLEFSFLLKLFIARSTAVMRCHGGSSGLHYAPRCASVHQRQNSRKYMYILTCVRNPGPFSFNAAWLSKLLSVFTKYKDTSLGALLSDIPCFDRL